MLPTNNLELPGAAWMRAEEEENKIKLMVEYIIIIPSKYNSNR
jgi:hypothetical protein